MKLTINSIVRSENNASVTLNYTAKKNDGTHLLTEDLSVYHVEADAAPALAYVKQALQNRVNQLQAEAASAVKPEIQKVIGQEFTV